MKLSTTSCFLLLHINNLSTTSALLPSPFSSHRYQRTLPILTDRKRSPSRRRRRIRRGPKHYYDDTGPSSIDYDDSTMINCPIYDDEPIDHAGLSKSIDEEYALEEAKINLSFWEILQRERVRTPSEFSSHMSPYQRAKRRMNFKKGNIESKYELMSIRDYGNPALLEKDHLKDPPTLDDLNQTPATFSQTYWSQPLFRVGVVAAAYFSFPYWCMVFIHFETIDPKKFNTVVNQLGPNVGVLYATILALTLGVLYNRFTRIQENVTTEATLLASLTRNLLCLFQDEPRWATDACQMIANQLRIMLSRTRGVELLSIMKADTYSNILALVDDYHYIHGCDEEFNAAQESTMGNLRADLTHIMEVRALRLSDEASSLPPTHFLLLTSLSAVSTIAYVTASLAVVDDLNDPPQEARLLFAGLVALYVLFFNFCKDLNGPFQGVYQIKRSNAVSHLLQTKWLIVNQLGDAINFGEFEDDKLQKKVGGAVEVSLLDKVKRFFSGNDTPEEIASVEAHTMATLAKELDEYNKVEASSETSSSEADIQSSKNDQSSEISKTVQPDEMMSTEHNLNVEPSPTRADEDKLAVEETMAISLEYNDDHEPSEPISISHAPVANSDLDFPANNSKHTKPLESSTDHEPSEPITISRAPVADLDSDLPASNSKHEDQFDYAHYFRSTSGFSS